MRVLAVDTSSERGSVCIAEGKQVLGEVRIASSIQYSERLFRSIEFLFHYMPFRLADIEIFVSARGPGSFTGLRVGLAAMEAFVAAHGKQGAGITTLEALAWKTGIRDALIVPMIDARRGDIYGSVYRRTGAARPLREGVAAPPDDTLVEEREPVVLKPAQWLSSLPQVPMVFCGDGAERYRPLIEEHQDWVIHPMSLYLASTMAELALTANVGPLAPLYIRKTDAEIARESIGSPSS